MNTREELYCETSLSGERPREKIQRRRSDRPLVRNGQTTVPAQANRRLLGDRRTEIREQRAEPQRGKQVSWPILIATTALVAVGAYSWLSNSGSVSAKAAPPAPLGLNVSHTNGGLRLVWNPSAPLLREAPEAELTIQDGDRMSRVFLSPGQIRSGSLAYTPVTGDVRFSLRAKSADRAATETVLALESPTVAHNSVTPAAMQPGGLTFPAAFSQERLR